MSAQITLRHEEAANELLARREAREGIRAYMDYMRPCALADLEYEPEAHHELIIDAVEKLVHEPAQRVLISLPPASGKSIWCSVIAATWALARDPTMKILCISNSADLAQDFAKRRRLVMETEQWQRLAETSLDPRVQAVEHMATQRGGCFYARGAGATVTGLRCDLLLIDDLIVGHADAMSHTLMQKLWRWLASEARTRLTPRGGLLMLGTIWSAADPMSLSLKLHADMLEQWTILKVPMECSDPAHDPLGRKMGERLWKDWFTEEQIVQAKRDVHTWSSLYQCQPIDDVNSWLPLEHIHVFEILPADDYTDVMAIDLALTLRGGDFSVACHFKISPDWNIFLVDMWRAQSTADEFASAITHMAARSKPRVILADRDNTLRVFSGVLQEQAKRNGVALPFRLLPHGNKNSEVRAGAFRAQAYQGRFHVKQAPWTAEVIAEGSSFPAPNSHDDIIDCLSLIGRDINNFVPARRVHADDQEIRTQIVIGEPLSAEERGVPSIRLPEKPRSGDQGFRYIGEEQHDQRFNFEKTRLGA